MKGHLKGPRLRDRNTDCCNAVFVEQVPAEHAANKIEGKRNGHTSAVRTSLSILFAQDLNVFIGGSEFFDRAGWDHGVWQSPKGKDIDHLQAEERHIPGGCSG